MATGGSARSAPWTAATDDVGVVRYNVHRSTTEGFTPSAANRVGQPTGPRSRTGPRPGPTTTGSWRRTPRATSASRRARRAPSSRATVTPSAPSAERDRVAGSVRSLDGGDRQRGRRPLQRPPLARTASRRAQRTGSPSRPEPRYTDTGLAAGTYFYRVTAEDAAGNRRRQQRGDRDCDRGHDRSRRCRHGPGRQRRRSPARST